MNNFDINADPLIQAAERVADELDRMAEIAASRGMSVDEIDAFAQQAIIAWQCRRNSLD